MTTSITKNKKNVLQKAIIILIWLCIWQGISMLIHKEILMVSPFAVLKNLSHMIFLGSFWKSVTTSVLRIMGGFFLGVGTGTLMAVVTYLFSWAEKFFSPVKTVIRATPVASIIILVLVWFRPNGVVIFISFLMVMPLVWENVYQGLKSCDGKLLEMAKVFRFTKGKTIRHIYIPSVMPFFVSAFTTSMGFAWKAGITAEVIANPPLSIGQNLYDAKIYLETADLFSWTVVVIILSMLIEKIFVNVLNSQFFAKGRLNETGRGVK